MNTHRYTPQLIVENEPSLRFNIPLYQRLFAWGEEQVKGLLYDLKEHFASSGDTSPYYLGMLSCIGRGNEYDLIDGQQRFTVMILLAVVLRQYDERWETFLDDGKRLNFTARPNDRDYLRALVDKNTDLEQVEKNEKMECAVRQIKSFMEKEFAGSEELCSSFAGNTFERLSFFFSVLPEEYLNNPMSLNKYFEAMNAGGKGLEQHEILKVQLLRGETQQEQLTRIWNSVCEMNHPVIKKEDTCREEDYRNKYRRAINLCKIGKYEEAFHLCESSYDKEDDIEIGQIAASKPKDETIRKDISEDQAILSFPEFLMLVLDIHLKLNGSYSFYRTDLLTAFKNNPLRDVHEFYHCLLFYRLLFDYYIITKESGINGNMYNMIAGQGSDFETDCVVQYQSMLYVSNTPFYNWLKPLLVQLATTPVSTMKDLLSMLKANDNALRTFPSSADALAYNNGPDRYWYWRLDYYLWEQKDKFFTDENEREIVDDYVFRANRSLEHLHPQHQVNNEEWPVESVNAFGNMAMISQSFNSQQSDDPVTVKFARVSEQAHNHALQSIKLYRMYLDAHANPDGWTKDIMEEHGRKMYELLKATFENHEIPE